jgi:hypothetical protein
MTQEELMAQEIERLNIAKQYGAQFPSKTAPQAQQQPQEQQGLLARIGAGFQNLRNDPEKMARLQMGLNSMRLNPDQGIAASAANTIKLAQARKQNTLDAASTVKFLQGRAAVDPMAAQALSAIQANPSMVKDIMGAYLSGQFKAPHMSKNIGKVQIAQQDMPKYDIKAGDQFTYHLDPNVTEGYSLVRLGGRGTTDQQQADMEADASLREADIAAARTQAKEYFNKYSSVNDQIRSLRQARQLIEDGAATGFVRQYLPAFDANTQALRNVANEMGIDIINSATFGALSATELRLALSTGFPQGLNEAETLKYIDQKIAVQDKFRRELLKKTNRLNSGIGFSQWTKEVGTQEEAERAVANPPQNSKTLMNMAAGKGVSIQYIWDRMNYEQRKAFMDQEPK